MCLPQLLSSLTSTGCAKLSAAPPRAFDATAAYTLLPPCEGASHAAHSCVPSALTALPAGLMAAEFGIEMSGSNQLAPIERSQRAATSPLDDMVTKTSPVCFAIAICAKLWNHVR